MILWTLLVVLYIALFVSLGMSTFRKGHQVLFWVGIIFPVLWIVGAIMPPTARAEGTAERRRLLHGEEHRRPATSPARC